MTTIGQSVHVQSAPTKASHPLDPLTPQEIEAAVAILRAGQSLGARVRFESVELKEPPKESVLSRNGHEPPDREAFIILLDNDTGNTYEAVVSLDELAVKSWTHVPGVQPRLMMDEFFDCENAVKASPDFQAALRKRGIDDTSLVMVDPWPAGQLRRRRRRRACVSPSPAAGSRPAPTTTDTRAPSRGSLLSST